MSSPITRLEPAQFAFTVRFDRGYRFLDLCGEAIIRLEDTLDPGWIPGETLPTGGTLHNLTLGLATRFDSLSLNVTQTEFMSFEHFLDQTCKIYEVVRCTFEIDRVLTPVFRAIYQQGFPDVDAAGQFLQVLGLCLPDATLVKELGGTQSALDFAICTNADESWQKSPTRVRNRFDARVIRQERQPFFDERIMLRLPLVSQRYHEAVAEMRKLRRQHSKISEIAVQFDIEKSLESEFNSKILDLPGFLTMSYQWAQGLTSFILRREQ